MRSLLWCVHWREAWVGFAVVCAVVFVVALLWCLHHFAVVCASERRPGYEAITTHIHHIRAGLIDDVKDYVSTHVAV